MACPSPPAGMPAEHPPGLAGRGCGDRVTPNTAGQELRTPRSITGPLAGWLEGPGRSVPTPALGACCFGDTCLPGSCCPWGEAVAVLAFPESTAGMGKHCTKSSALSLDSDPNHLQSPLEPPKSTLGHHMWHLV